MTPDESLGATDKTDALVAALQAAVDWAAPMAEAPRESRPEWFDTARKALAAQAPAAVAGEGGADYVPGRLDAEAPPRIWLQIDTSGNNDERDESWPGPDGVTWQDESIGGLEIQYVRADLASRPAADSEAVDCPQCGMPVIRGDCLRCGYEAPPAAATCVDCNEAGATL